MILAHFSTSSSGPARCARTASTLPQRPFAVLPQCSHGPTTVLPQCYHSVTTVLPQRPFVVLPQCYHGVTTVLPRCCHRGQKNTVPEDLVCSSFSAIRWLPSIRDGIAVPRAARKDTQPHSCFLGQRGQRFPHVWNEFLRGRENHKKWPNLSPRFRAPAKTIYL